MVGVKIEKIVLRLVLPVGVSELAAVSDGIGKLHGKDTVFMRQVGPYLELFKETETPDHPATLQVSSIRGAGDANSP